MTDSALADRFVAELEVTPPCWTCVHKHRGGPTCAAFPQKIPDEILSGRHQHREPYPGDGGIVYARRLPVGSS